MKTFWIVCGVLGILVGLCWVSNLMFEDSAVAQATDDLSREQQVELMRACVKDARESSKWQKGMFSGEDTKTIGHLAVAFFEYRTRGR